MNIVVTGSLGRISRPLTEELVQKGHAVTVISSDPEKRLAIEALGATAAIGTIEDVNFLTNAFTRADAVYTMIPPKGYSDPNFDLNAYVTGIGNNYAQAIRQSGVTRVVHLSSIGAHLEAGSGLILHHRQVELTLNELPDEVAVLFMRPTAIYYNLYSYVNMIKSQDVIAANYGAGDMDVWVAPTDIATAVAEALETPFTGRPVRYVASDELTGNETAHILGAAIGKPDLKWIIIPSEQMLQGLVSAGMQPSIAAGMVDMYASVHNGTFMEDYYRNRPAVMGKVKMTDFAKDFAKVYNQK